MPLIKEFEGKRIKRTLCIGDQVAILFKRLGKDQPSERILVPLTQYLAGVKCSFLQVSPKNPGMAQDNGSTEEHQCLAQSVLS